MLTHGYNFLPKKGGTAQAVFLKYDLRLHCIRIALAAGLECRSPGPEPELLGQTLWSWDSGICSHTSPHDLDEWFRCRTMAVSLPSTVEGTILSQAVLTRVRLPKGTRAACPHSPQVGPCDPVVVSSRFGRGSEFIAAF